MRQINLLPPEIAQRRRVRQITLALGAAGLALLAVLVLVFIVQAARLAGERGHLDDVKRTNANLQRQISALQSFAILQQTLRNKEQLLDKVTANEVRWSILLNDISVVIPSDVWLENFSGSVQAPAPGSPVVPGAPLGTIQMSGKSFTHLDVAKWLSRIAGVNEFAFPYLSLSAKSIEGTTEVVTFNSSVQLSQAALRQNQPGGKRAP
jgi:Tfp pilus assembly protein PilN